MNRRQARKTLERVQWASKSDKPMTNICAVLGIDPEWFSDDETGERFRETLIVRMADLRRDAR